MMLHLVYALREQGLQAEYDAHYAHEALMGFLETSGGRARYLDGIRRFALDLYQAAMEPTAKSLFLDKTPRYYLITPELAELFPEARFIFLRRHPLSVLASVISAQLEGNLALLSQKDTLTDLLRGPRLILEGPRHAKRSYSVRYEDLVVDPGGVSSKMCEALDLTFEEGMLSVPKAVQLGKARFGDSRSVHLHDKAVPDYVDRWREALNDDQGRELAHGYLRSLGPELVEAMGYEFDALMEDLGPRPRGRVIAWSDLTRPPTSIGVRKRIRLLSRGREYFDQPTLKKRLQFAVRGYR
jgi:Sulfotransferase family